MEDLTLDPVDPVMDDPAVDPVDPVVDDPADPSEPDANAVADPSQPEPVEVKGDERLLPAWIRAMKQSDPAGFKQAKGLFFGHRSFEDKLKDFDLDGTKTFLDEHGGRETLAQRLNELQTESQELRSLNSLLSIGDGRVVDALMQQHPDGFAKLAPVIAEKWAQADPQGYERAMSNVIAGTIQQSGIPMFLERMALYLESGKTAEVMQWIQQLQGWAGGFQKAATAPVQQRANTADPKLTEREQTVAQREQQLFETDLTRDVNGFRDPLIAQQLSSFVSRRPDDADARELAINTVRMQVIQRLAADKDFQNKLNALTARRDKEGALRLIKSRETAAITEIAPKVGRTIFGAPAAPAKQAAKSAAVKPNPQAQKPHNRFDEIWGS